MRLNDSAVGSIFFVCCLDLMEEMSEKHDESWTVLRVEQTKPLQNVSTTRAAASLDRVI